MLPIVVYEDEVLRKKAAMIADFDENLSNLAENMVETMYKGNGIGLAGPQVNCLKRIFVCIGPDEKPVVFINPEIIGTGEKLIPMEEGCLSIPGIYAQIERPEEVQVQAFNLNGKPFKVDADGLFSRVIQHELDHLNGVLFIDKLSEKKRQRLLKQYNKRFKA